MNIVNVNPNIDAATVCQLTSAAFGRTVSIDEFRMDGTTFIFNEQSEAEATALPEIIATAQKQSVEIILDKSKLSLAVQAEDTFYRLASEKTGEYITPLKLIEWKDKEVLALQWEAGEKPNPPDLAVYKMAYDEAVGDPVKDAWQMLQSWLDNAKPWRLMYNGFMAWRQAFTARLKAATTEAGLEALRDGMEAELRGLLGL